MRMNGVIKQGLSGGNHSTAWLSTRLRDKRYGLSNPVIPHREGHYVPSVPDSRRTVWTETREEPETHWRSLYPCVRVWGRTCVWGVTVRRFGVLVHDVNQDDNQVCQADWIWNMTWQISKSVWLLSVWTVAVKIVNTAEKEMDWAHVWSFGNLECLGWVLASGVF